MQHVVRGKLEVTCFLAPAPPTAALRPAEGRHLAYWGPEGAPMREGSVTSPVLDSHVCFISLVQERVVRVRVFFSKSQRQKVSCGAGIRGPQQALQEQ